MSIQILSSVLNNSFVVFSYFLFILTFPLFSLHYSDSNRHSLTFLFFLFCLISNFVSFDFFSIFFGFFLYIFYLFLSLFILPFPHSHFLSLSFSLSSFQIFNENSDSRHPSKSPQKIINEQPLTHMQSYTHMN